MSRLVMPPPDADHIDFGGVAPRFESDCIHRHGAKGGKMPIATKYLFVVSMDVTKEKEALFNEVYDSEHVPLLLKVPGVRAVTRLKTEPAAVTIGGERKVLDGGSE